VEIPQKEVQTKKKALESGLGLKNPQGKRIGRREGEGERVPIGDIDFGASIHWDRRMCTKRGGELGRSLTGCHSELHNLGRQQKADICIH
jgi:hypothetical protein